MASRSTGCGATDLLTAAGGFRARRNQVWQIVLSPRGVPGGYRSAR
jgi:cyclopropane-fatty-acyl-phospholipid synthase